MPDETSVVAHPFYKNVICGVCRRPLEQTSSADGKSLRLTHGPAVRGVPPHRPQPIISLMDPDMVLVCDLCGSPGTTWEYAVEPFAMEIPGAKTDFLSDDNWVVCEACHADIEDDTWRAIWGRWLEYNAESAVDMDASVLKLRKHFHQAQYSLFRSKRIGEPWRINEDMGVFEDQLDG